MKNTRARTPRNKRQRRLIIDIVIFYVDALNSLKTSMAFNEVTVWWRDMVA